MHRSDVAVAVRPGEHGCCRFASVGDRERTARAFVRDGLARGHKVAYHCDRDDVRAFAERLAELDDRVEPALGAGQLEVRSALDAYAGDGKLDVTAMLASLRAEHARALAEGYPALSLTAEMSWALRVSGGVDVIVRYERGIDDFMPSETLGVLCQYDPGGFPPGTMSDVVAAHAVDLSPELATISRSGLLAASRIRASRTLRLAGELDFTSADAVAAVLDGHYHGDLRLDLGDLRFVDVAGMRALRGRTGQGITITQASDPARRLIGLLAWDTDPGVTVVDAV